VTQVSALSVKHASEAALKSDGMRVLVERHWPPGKRRDDVAVDLWLREAAPSEALRRWYRRAPRGWDDYVGRYRAEMAQRRDILRLLHELGRRGPVTLIHTTRDPDHNNAVALRKILDELA
jgi:uncharacterized protein YeaO (DUF488 family)